MPIVIAFTLVAYQILLIFVHLALYAAVAAAFGVSGFWVMVAFILLAVSFIGTSILVHYSGNRLVGWLYTAASYWFGLVHFFFMATVVFLAVANIFYMQGIYVPLSLLGGISFTLFFLLHLYGTWNSGRAELTEDSVTLLNLPPRWRRKKAVFVSDLHLGPVRGRAFAEKVARKVMEQKPEAIFIGGDMFDGGRCDQEGFIEPLRQLKAPLGVYFVTGNHDYYVNDPPKLLGLIRAAGMRILDNEAVDCGGLQLVGVDYLAAHKKEDFERILAGIAIDKNKPSVLLKHEPDNMPVAEAAGISITMSGHTHRGQIYPLMYFTKQIYKGFDYGLKRLGAMRVLTSSGVGTFGPPLRLGTKSEIVLITFS